MIVYLKTLEGSIININSNWSIVNLDDINIFQKPLIIDSLKNYTMVCSNDGISINHDLKSIVINYLLHVDL